MTENNEPVVTLPTHEQIMIMAKDMVRELPTNQAELWCRMLYRLTLVAPLEWSLRGIWAVETIRTLLPILLDREMLMKPVTREEAYGMGVTGVRIPLFALLTLFSLITGVEQEVGPDHQDFAPVRWFREGTRVRAGMLTRQRREEGKW